MTDTFPSPETAVPVNDEPAGRCPFCDRPFTTDRLVWLHVEEHHDDRVADELTDEQRHEIRAARAQESDELFFYQLRVTIALGVTYSVTALSLMFFLG